MRVFNDEVVRAIGVSRDEIERIIAREQAELERREQLYRGGRPQPNVTDRVVILVDDGLATGATMKAAVKALQQMRPKRLVVAVPTAPPETCEELAQQVDEMICAITPVPFYGVGLWYSEFPQTSDQEVRDLLDEAAGLVSGR